MKKLLSLFFALLLSLTIISCGGGDDKKDETSKTDTSMSDKTNTEVCVPAPGEICPA